MGSPVFLSAGFFYGKGAFMFLFAKYVRYLCVLFLFAGFLVLGCEEPKDDEYPKSEFDTNLIGTWTSNYGDSYTISSTYLSSGYGAYIDYAGTIKHTTAFSSTAGVIIIEYDADKKPIYYDSFDNYGDPDHVLPLKGNFIGVYYQDLVPNVSVKIGGAYTDGGAEEPTLDAAKTAFTLDREGNYMSYYGTYAK